MAMLASIKTPSRTFDRLGRGVEAKAIGTIGAREYQRQTGSAVLEVVKRLRVGRCRIGMIDALHDLPWRSGRPPSDRRGIAGAPINWLDP